MNANNFDVKILDYWTNREEFLYLFKKSFDDFYNYVKDNFPKTKLILNKVQVVNYVLKEDGSYYLNKERIKLLKI